MKLIKYKLSDVAKVEISSVDKKTNEGETSVKLCNFTDVYHNWAITKELEPSFMVASANNKELAKFSIKKGQVAFTKDSETRDDIGIPTYIADDFENVVLGYHCALITPDEDKVLGSYINAFMHTSFIKKYFENNATGSGQRYTLSVETMENMPLLLPSLEEQRRVTKILSDLDKKIALNSEINRNLEAFAKQLYDYWFVQFDFPNENGKPYKASGGKMVWNEQLKRKIPKDWKVSNICSLLTMYMERCDYVPDGLVYTPIEVLPRKSMSFYEVAPLEEAVSGLCRYYKGDVLLSNRRIYFHKVCIAPFDGVTRDTVITLRSNDDKYYCYAFQTINSDHFISWATKHSYGSEQPVFSWNEARNYLVAIPPTQIAEKFESIVRFSIDKVCISQLETQNLIKQRDELLPLLMNGQVAINSDLSQC